VARSPTRARRSDGFGAVAPPFFTSVARLLTGGVTGSDGFGVVTSVIGAGVVAVVVAGVGIVVGAGAVAVIGAGVVAGVGVVVGAGAVVGVQVEIGEGATTPFLQVIKVSV